MIKRAFSILFPILFLWAIALQAQTSVQKGHLSATVTKAVNMGYLIHFPQNYDDSGNEKYPLLLFLHGSGERGNDLDLVKVHGPSKVADAYDLPFIILSPQCNEPTWWNVEDVKVMIDQIITDHPVDTDRLYVTGLSMGGRGTWEILMKYPDLFAAAIPVCGAGYHHRANLINHIPVWVFHGDKDDVISPEHSRWMVEALQELDAPVKYTRYPEAGHDAWTATYNNREIYKWLLQHKKSTNN